MNDSSPTPTDAKPSHRFRTVTVIVAVSVAVALGFTALFLFLHARQQKPHVTSDTSDPSSLQSNVDSPNTGKPGRVATPPAEARDYSTSNVVSILLGQESDADGLRHLADEPDGRTTIETLDGVPCRYLNRKPKSYGYLYFAIHPDFKRDELKAARIEIECRTATTVLVRLQYDSLGAGDLHTRYKAASRSGAETATQGPSSRYTMIRATNQWQTLTFDVADGAFMNSQNGGADFRLEVSPAEIYVRRVTVARQRVQTQPPTPETNR